MSKKLKKSLQKIKKILLISIVTNLILAVPVLTYLFSSSMDEWLIKNSLQRFCEEQKETFSGEQFSTAYLCSFLPEKEW